MESQPSSSAPDHSPTYPGDSSNGFSWLEKLLLNLFSYSLVLVPVAVIVLATKHRLGPKFLQSSALIQLFVNGHYYTGRANSKQGGNTDRDSESLLAQADHVDAKKQTPTRRKISSNDPDCGRRDIIKFLWCFFGLMISYLVWGVLQEKIMTTRYSTTGQQHRSLNGSDPVLSVKRGDTHITFHDSQFLVFINRIIAFILAIVAILYDRPRQKSPRLLYMSHDRAHYRDLQLECRLNGGHEPVSKPSAPLYLFVFCSLSNILSSWCQYEALKYVNFPTQVLSKTFKIVPVMIMSKLLLQKKYKSLDYTCALALSVGMFIFLLNQPPVIPSANINHPNSTESAYHIRPPEAVDLNRRPTARRQQQDLIGGSGALMSGLILLSLYLAFDSFTGNWQKSLFTRYQVTNWQMMAAVNLYSILLTLTSLYQLGNLRPALKMLASSRPLLFDCLLMSVMSSVGQFFVYYTINQFGPVLFTVIMTFRQFLAILISCALYGHHLTAGSGLGILLVFMVVAFQLWHRSAGAQDKSGAQRAPTDAIRLKLPAAGGQKR